MFMPWQKVTLTTRILTRFQNKHQQTPKCPLCPYKFKLGDTAMSHQKRDNGTEYVCLECYRNLWL